MRILSVSGLGVVSLALAFSACGSDDLKKKAPGYNAGGEGGEGGGPGPSIQGGAAGAPGGPDAGGRDAVGGRDAGGGEGGSAASIAGAAGDTGSGGGGGEGGGTTVEFNGLYIGENGDDLALGTTDDPFETLAHAASVAQPGDTIVFLDGSYVVGGAPIAIADGVDLMAENTGQASLTGQGGVLLNLAGSTRIEGLKFTAYQTVAQYPAGATAMGSLEVVDSTFTNCTGVCLVATGSVALSISAPVAQVVGNGGPGLVSVSNTASVSISGGVLQNFGVGGIIRALGDTTVTLQGVQVLDGSGAVLSLTENAVGFVDNIDIASLATTVFSQTGQSELTVKNSDVSIKPAQSSPFNCFSLTGQGTGSLTIEDTQVRGCGTGLRGAIPKTLTLLRVELHDLSFGGMDLTTGGPNLGGKVTITDSKFYDVGYVGFRIGDGSSLIDFKMRRTEVAITAASQWDGIIVNAANASTIDFGTLADPGGNTILGVSTLKTGLRLAIVAATVQAVGNTWTPNVQGADSQGKYTVVGVGAKLDVTGAVDSGQNYVKPYATLTLRLAENP